MGSRRSTTPSLLPPCSGSSQTPRAVKPLRSVRDGWGVKFPNSSRPLSTVPLPLRSSTRKTSSEPGAVQAIFSGVLRRNEKHDVFVGDLDAGEEFVSAADRRMILNEARVRYERRRMRR